MSDTITYRVLGVESVKTDLDSLGERVRERLHRAILASAYKLQGAVKSKALSGVKSGGVLNNISGKLRRSINVRTVIDQDNVIQASVGTNLSYGHFWELGFHGEEQVKAHFRKIKAGTARKKLDGKRQQVSQGVAYVKAHPREVNEAPRSFLLSTFRDMQSEIRDRIARAILEVK